MVPSSPAENKTAFSQFTKNMTLAFRATFWKIAVHGDYGNHDLRGKIQPFQISREIKMADHGSRVTFTTHFLRVSIRAARASVNQAKERISFPYESYFSNFQIATVPHLFCFNFYQNIIFQTEKRTIIKVSLCTACQWLSGKLAG